MPRDGSNIYGLPFPAVVGGTTVSSGVHNGTMNDIAQDLNTARPIVAGGTGAVNADAALFNLNAAKAAQLVTNYDSHLWIPGTFYSATTATGEPVDGHAFSGIAYINEALANPPTNLNVTLEARDVTDGKLYIRRKVAGSWGSWTLDGDLSGVTAALATKVNLDGTNTMTGKLNMPATIGGDATTIATTKGYVDNLDATQKTYIDTSIGSLVTTYIRYDTAQTLTANQMAQARANIDVTKKNYIVNGAMMVSQENGTTAGTTTPYYPVDQFFSGFINGGTNTIAQVASVTPGGSPNRVRYTATAADAAMAAGDYAAIGTKLEGLRVTDLMSGTANAKTITIRFGCKGPAGTYHVGIENGAQNRSYPATFTITGGEANTDVIKTVTVQLDTTGTWLNDNGIGMVLFWTLMAGTTFQGTANAWQAGNIFSSAAQFNFMGTAGNVFELFDVSLTEGSVAPPFRVPDYPFELALCKRYWQLLPVLIAGGGNGVGGSVNFFMFNFTTTFRIAPAAVLKTAPFLQNVGAYAIGGQVDTDRIRLDVTPSITGSCYIQGAVWTLSARM